MTMFSSFSAATVVLFYTWWAWHSLNRSHSFNESYVLYSSYTTSERPVVRGLYSGLTSERPVVRGLCNGLTRYCLQILGFLQDMQRWN